MFCQNDAMRLCLCLLHISMFGTIYPGCSDRSDSIRFPSVSVSPRCILGWCPDSSLVNRENRCLTAQQWGKNWGKLWGKKLGKCGENGDKYGEKYGENVTRTGTRPTRLRHPLVSQWKPRTESFT